MNGPDFFYEYFIEMLNFILSSLYKKCKVTKSNKWRKKYGTEKECI